MTHFARRFATTVMVLSCLTMGAAMAASPNTGDAGLTSLQAPASASAQGGAASLQGRAGVFAQLNLSAQQKEQIKTLFQNRRTQMQNHSDLRAKRDQLIQMLKTGSGNKDQAIGLMHEIQQQQNGLFEERISFIYDLKAILTPEQFEKANQLMQQRPMNMGNSAGPQGASGVNPRGGGFPGGRRMLKGMGNGQI